MRDPQISPNRSQKISRKILIHRDKIPPARQPGKRFEIRLNHLFRVRTAGVSAGSFDFAVSFFLPVGAPLAAPAEVTPPQNGPPPRPASAPRLRPTTRT